jgi:hypothetical protein
MPRGKPTLLTPAKQQQRKILWDQTGEAQEWALMDWDCKTEPLVEALLGVLASGATVVLRPGSGGRSVGVAIWEGDVRHSPTWCYEPEELDSWATRILERLHIPEQAAD